jgi:hypothetical protein
MQCRHIDNITLLCVIILKPYSDMLGFTPAALFGGVEPKQKTGVVSGPALFQTIDVAEVYFALSASI